MLTKKIFDMMEKNDVQVHNRAEQDGQFYREIEFYSPAGEDVIETVWYDGTENGFITAFDEMADNFDVDEHAELWIDGRGKNGVPKTIRELTTDAEAIKDKLRELADMLNDYAGNNGDDEEDDEDEEENTEDMTATEYALHRVEMTRRELMELSAKIELGTDIANRLSEIINKAIDEVEALADEG